MSPCLFDLYTEHVMKMLAWIWVTSWRNNNLRHADDSTLMMGSEEELKNLLMRVKKESEKFGLKLSIKNKQTNKQTNKS